MCSWISLGNSLFTLALFILRSKDCPVWCRFIALLPLCKFTFRRCSRQDASSTFKDCIVIACWGGWLPTLPLRGKSRPRFEQMRWHTCLLFLYEKSFPVPYTRELFCLQHQEGSHQTSEGCVSRQASYTVHRQYWNGKLFTVAEWGKSLLVSSILFMAKTSQI